MVCRLVKDQNVSLRQYHYRKADLCTLSAAEDRNRLNYIFEAGDTDVTFTVTSEAGSVRVYTLHVHRPVDHNPYPNTIAVDGMLSVYCNNNEYDVNGDYCKYIFDKETGEYNITVPYQIRHLLRLPEDLE